MLRDEADFVIIGTGAGGATAARVLAAAGLEVIMLEEGPKLEPAERPEDLLRAMQLAVRDVGTQTTTGTAPIVLMQGKLVGGSTAINSGIIWRMPEDVRRDWREHHGLDWLVDDEGLERAFEIIERELEVTDTQAEVLGGNAQKMAEACRALGLPGKAIARNARRCQGSARCLQGCRTGARQSMDVSYVPRAIDDGARLHTGCRATEFATRRGRAVAVRGRAGERDRFEVRARRGVIVAAGALHTPVLLHQAGLRGLVGHRFQMHPGCAVVGRFEQSVRMSFGATQGYEVPMRAQGFKLESLSLPPEMLAARIPGAGPRWQERLAELDRFAQWAVQARMRAHGRVRVSWTGRPVVTYEPLPSDLAIIQRGVALMCRMLFATGATEVYPGVRGVPEVIRGLAEVESFERLRLRPRDVHLVGSHLFGTAAAGADAGASVVGPDLQAHALPGLYVMDASVFPTNLGVNPQHSIMGVVWRAAERLANDERRAVAA